MPHPDALIAAGFDALSATATILDTDGEIVETNDTWREFGRENGLVCDPTSEETNYLAVCDGSDDETAIEAAAGIRSVLDGSESSFSLEYPCHSPDQERWFTMDVSPFEYDGDRYVLVVHVDVTERRLAEAQVAQQATRMEQFARMLSHDLRNPLSVALAETEFLAEAVDEDGLESIHSSLERMETIVEDALLLATTETVESTRSFPLEVLADNAWSHVDTGDATLVVEGSQVILSDPDLVGHLFENLFRNSVEHGSGEESRTRSDAVDHTEGAVTVRVGPLEDGFYVEDDGPGIPDGDRERVFDAGYTTDRDGSGYGLEIVARVAAAHGWEVTVTREETGGARFEITGVTVPSTRTTVESSACGDVNRERDSSDELS